MQSNNTQKQKMSTLSKTEQNQKIQQFIDLFQQGVEAWMRAGEIIVELVENDPHVYDYIIQQCPNLNAGVIGRFEQMGRKILHPQLLLTNSPGAKALTKMPISVQERYLTEPVVLIVGTPDGTDALLVKAKDLTQQQSRQVFAQNRLRTEGEQKAWLIENRSKNAKFVGSNLSPWKISKGKLKIEQGVILSKEQVAAIYMQM